MGEAQLMRVEEEVEGGQGGEAMLMKLSMKEEEEEEVWVVKQEGHL